MGLPRYFLLLIRKSERKLHQQKRNAPHGWLARIMKTGVLHVDATSVSNGAAIGMFWAFIPMPFQMVPASFFCLLARANLPVAILCVWISNPLTYAPIFYGQYQLGLWLFGGDSIMSLKDFSAHLSNDTATSTIESLGSYFAPILTTLLQGALVSAVAFSIAGWVTGQVLFYFIQSSKKHRNKKSQYSN